MAENKPHGRHELKFLVSYAEYLALKSRVSAMLDYDTNAGENGYFIRSIYFDDVYESVYYEKMAGLCDRKKYRIRAYNNSPDYIILECKEKHNKWVDKHSAVIDLDTCNALSNGDFSTLADRDEHVCREVYTAAHELGIKPSVIVDYHRDAFVYPVSNIRITFDKELHASGLNGFDMFTTDIGTDLRVPVYINDSVIVEVKYDDYIPTFIRDIIPSFMGVPMSISKYCLCKGIYKSIRC